MPARLRPGLHGDVGESERSTRAVLAAIAALALAAALPAPAAAGRPDPPTWSDEFAGTRAGPHALGAPRERGTPRGHPHAGGGRRRRRRADDQDLHRGRRALLGDDRHARLGGRLRAGVRLLRGADEVQQRAGSVVGVLAAVADDRRTRSATPSGGRRDGRRRAPRAVRDRAGADAAADVRTDERDRGPRAAGAHLGRLRPREPVGRQADRPARRPGQRQLAHVGAELDADRRSRSSSTTARSGRRAGRSPGAASTSSSAPRSGVLRRRDSRGRLRHARDEHDEHAGRLRPRMERRPPARRRTRRAGGVRGRGGGHGARLLKRDVVGDPGARARASSGCSDGTAIAGAIGPTYTVRPATAATRCRAASPRRASAAPRAPRATPSRSRRRRLSRRHRSHCRCRRSPLPPQPVPPPPPPVLDRSAPSAVLSGATSQRLGTTVAVTVVCRDEPCGATVTGTIRVPRVGAARARAYRPTATVVIGAGRRRRSAQAVAERPRGDPASAAVAQTGQRGAARARHRPRRQRENLSRTVALRAARATRDLRSHHVAANASGSGAGRLTSRTTGVANTWPWWRRPGRGTAPARPRERPKALRPNRWNVRVWRAN